MLSSQAQRQAPNYGKHKNDKLNVALWCISCHKNHFHQIPQERFMLTVPCLHKMYHHLIMQALNTAHVYLLPLNKSLFQQKILTLMNMSLVTTLWSCISMKNSNGIGFSLTKWRLAASAICRPFNVGIILRSWKQHKLVGKLLVTTQHWLNIIKRYRSNIVVEHDWFSVTSRLCQHSRKSSDQSRESIPYTYSYIGHPLMLVWSLHECLSVAMCLKGKHCVAFVIVRCSFPPVGDRPSKSKYTEFGT